MLGLATRWLPAVAVAMTTIGSAPAPAAPDQLPGGIVPHETKAGLTLTMGSNQQIYRLDLDRAAKRRRFPGQPASRCNAACQKLWIPIAAPADFKAQGDWTVTARPDGLQQLTFKGDPLYTFTQRDFKAASKLLVYPSFLTGYSGKPVWLVDGVPFTDLYWHEVEYQPGAPQTAAPSGVTMRWDKSRYVFDDTQKHGLYTQKKSKRGCDPDCNALKPLVAPLGAQSIGDWQPVQSPGGERYWSYRKSVVYYAPESVTPPARWQPLEAQ